MNASIELILAIRECRRLRKGKLDVKFTGHRYVWHRDEDAGWIRYRNARSIVRKYPAVEKLFGRFL